ncbi:MAG: hypothetical protein PF690_16660, partial [Deltaproteobacteria bacterium]|nr:hypothetical protein [Deltaproteobacteria bacterium]
MHIASVFVFIFFVCLLKNYTHRQRFLRNFSKTGGKNKKVRAFQYLMLYHAKHEKHIGANQKKYFK